MKKAGCSVDKMIKLRQDIHQWPEGGFKEFKTQKLIFDTLIGLGIDKKNIKKCAGTGLVVDIKGTGKPDSKASKTINNIAIRADIDGLPMKENNQSLPYKSKTEFAHMCGHDGHVAMLMAATEVFVKKRDEIPSNKTVRLLF